MKPFEIEKEQAPKENRPPEAAFNVFFLGVDERIGLMSGFPLLCEEHREGRRSYLNSLGILSAAK